MIRIFRLISTLTLLLNLYIESLDDVVGISLFHSLLVRLLQFSKWAGFCVTDDPEFLVCY